MAAESFALRDRLSIVLLTYNCAHRVEPVLERLLCLELPVIAVDNASTDDTVAVLSKHPGIKVVALPHNVGAEARNIGVERARTPYVAFCDDDGWYDGAGLVGAIQALDHYPRLGLVNCRILVNDDGDLDPISVEMAASPLPDEHGMPGAVLMSFMAGAAIVRTDAYTQVGGYDPQFFIGGEEETLAVKLARFGWQMRYLPDVVVHHRPSVANAPHLRAYGMRNTLWNAWLHRRCGSAVRWTLFILADTPKNRDWVRGAAMTLKGMPWVMRRREPMSADLDAKLCRLDERRFHNRRRLFTRRDPVRERTKVGAEMSAAKTGIPTTVIDESHKTLKDVGDAAG